MASALMNILRLGRAGIVMAQHGVRFVPKGMKVPLILHLARFATLPISLITAPFRIGQPKAQRVASALNRLGPSYIKLGQFLATRADVIGKELAQDLSHLQDKLPPFSMSEARRAIEAALPGKLEDHFGDFSDPIAAASIAQVHKATVTGATVTGASVTGATVTGASVTGATVTGASVTGATVTGASVTGATVTGASVTEPTVTDSAVTEATATDANNTTQHVAVKILRPNVERRFRHDLDSYYFAASIVERFHPPSRRLKPVAIVDTLKRTTELEMDLRLEAAAISEMADNIANDDMPFRVPTVDWNRTAKRVLTLQWIDGTKISDLAALKEQGFDLRELGQTILRAFLTHAMRDGFFHADMHQGNLLVDPSGQIVAVDFGIMGRLGPKERRFLAEILHGLITRDYTRASQAHFEAGYVPPHHSVATFAQALRAIGEPIHGRTADQISMADLLGQLFAYTEVFDMETRPELIMLQKSMVIVEGVARSLDPELNLWSAAEPVARAWMEDNLGPAGLLKDARDGAGDMGKFLSGVPSLLAQAENTALALGDMARSGIALDEATIARLANAQSRADRPRTLAIWLGALALIALAAARWLA